MSPYDRLCEPDPRGRGGGFKKRAFWAGGGFKTLDGEDSDAPDNSERPLRLRAWAILMTPRLCFSGRCSKSALLAFQRNNWPGC